MSRRKLQVRQIREILRYHIDHGVSYGDIATALKTSKGSVWGLLNKQEEFTTHSMRDIRQQQVTKNIHVTFSNK